MTGSHPGPEPGSAGSALLRARRWLVPLLAFGVLAIALWALQRELHAISYHELASAVRAVPRERLLAALGLSVLAFLILPGYDALALRYVRHPLPAGQTIFASVIAYAFSQNLGFPVLTGGSIRYRFWSAWGLSTAEIALAVTFSVVTFWLGIFSLGGGTLLVAPIPDGMEALVPPGVLRPVGAAMVAMVAVYLGWNVLRRGTAVALRDWEFRVPGPRLAAAQLVVSGLDWTVAGAAAYVLLPDAPGLTFATFLGFYLLAQVVGLVSHVPGGLGVFETLVVLLLKPYLPSSATLAALVAYRAIYYLLPFAVAVALLAGHEVVRRGTAVRAAAQRTGALAGRWVPAALPAVLSASAFLGGVILVLSGATPPIQGRMGALVGVLPLELVELSHFTGSVAGVGLLVLAWALRRRIDAAWGLTVALLIVGIVASLLKGLDWEEALALTGVLSVVLPCRRAFYRRAVLGAEALSPGWFVAILAVVAAAIWLGMFSFKHVEYGNDLWWRFAERGDAPRFLRATTGAVGLLFVVGLLRLLRQAEAEPALPTPAELARAQRIAATSPDPAANLALLGDKALLFPEADGAAGGAGDGFLMYGVEGRSWVALGDPIGPPAVRRELGWRFHEAADRHGAWPVFYEVGAEGLPLYIDLGLTLLKLGEEARVALDTFSLEGGGRRGLRRTRKEVEKHGATFEIAPAGAVPGLLPELRAISDAWLAEKRTREKGFSLGRFDAAYLCHFPVALVRVEGRIVAFANLWPGGDKAALSVDLMRYAPGIAPPDVMEYLFIELMLWGKAESYRGFSLGMAPLSGLEHHALAPLWSRAGSMLFRHGEHFYNFQGLRAYKEKFDPTWEPRYLASPGGLALPRILTNVATLISGGLKGVLAK